MHANFLTQHVLEPTRGENASDIVLSSQYKLVDIAKIYEPLGSSDHILTSMLNQKVKIKRKEGEISKFYKCK